MYTHIYIYIYIYIFLPFFFYIYIFGISVDVSSVYVDVIDLLASLLEAVLVRLSAICLQLYYMFFLLNFKFFLSNCLLWRYMFLIVLCYQEVFVYIYYFRFTNSFYKGQKSEKNFWHKYDLSVWLNIAFFCLCQLITILRLFFLLSVVVIFISKLYFNIQKL